MKGKKRLILVCMTLVLAFGLTGCKKAMVQIRDKDVATEIEVGLPRTVEKILAEAEIVLNEGDEVVPSLDTKLKESQEIVISRKSTIHLTVEGETKDIVMVGGCVQDVLDQEGIKLDENQHVNHEMDEYLEDGMDIKVFYQFNITVQCDGKTEEKEVESVVVKDALEECGITLGENDRINTEMTDNVTAGMEIVINRVTFEEITEKEETPFKTKRVDDDSLQKGKETVSQKGENGEKEIVYKITYVDGTEESREIISETVTKEAVNKIVKVGAKKETVSKKPSSSGNSGSSGSSSSGSASSGKQVVSKKAYYDCDGSGHGYYEIKYSDGSVKYEEF